MTASKRSPPLVRHVEDGNRCELTSPTALPKAGGFLWNKTMMIHFTCRGYATAQFMQPEPAKYSHAPNIEAKTFMQPEQAYYSHFPGRFVYVKDEESGKLFSAPHEPVRAPPDDFTFSIGRSDVLWSTEALDGIRVEMDLSLPVNDAVELWTVKVTNLSSRERKLSVYPYFTIGYMSWMNQSAKYRDDLGGIIGSSITPYQKAQDYFKNKTLKDKTYFLCEPLPSSWEARQEAFEGEGGLHAPSAILQAEELGKGDARYETPVAAVQYRLDLSPGSDRTLRFVFGAALDDKEIRSVRSKYLSQQGFETARGEYNAYIDSGVGCLEIQSPNTLLDMGINKWLPRQVFYHGDVNRLSTDPQTRNYLQDNMGMAYINPSVARAALITALSQQKSNGAMPDGVIIVPGAELKYINRVPHTDHCVWLPIALELYLSETADYNLLEERIHGDDKEDHTVFERLCRAMDWLDSSSARDARGLSYIAQGDWCDPMNMVGYKGKGVSGWLTVATGYALNLWASICEDASEADVAGRYRKAAAGVNAAANAHFWHGEWFARGITDDDVVFGTREDPEGKIWLNPQAWSILGGAADKAQIAKMLPHIDHMLGTPYGVLMFWPPFTGMREDIGRVTQKFPGQGENGSVYNHAAAFYVHALYSIGEADRAYELLRLMWPGPDDEDYIRRGQLPVYIPNYYRGGWKEIPDRAGRSSQLFNTGTASWAYRSFIEGLCGLKGDRAGLGIRPQMPSAWDQMRVKRKFRGATFDVEIERGDVQDVEVSVGGQKLDRPHIGGIEPGKVYHVAVVVPF